MRDPLDPGGRPRPRRALHIGGYWRGPNDVVRHMMLGLRKAGLEVLEYCTDEHHDALELDGRSYDRGTHGPVWLRWEKLREPVEQFRPDVVICNAGGLSFRPEVAAELRRNCGLLGVALSDPDVFEAATSRIACNFHLFLTNAPGCVPLYRAAGANAMELPVGTNEDFFHPVPPKSEFECEVLVLGRALPDRVEPVKALHSHFWAHLYGEGWDQHGLGSRGLLYGDDVLCALSSARIAVIFGRTPAGHLVLKIGLFDFLAAGALVATDYQPDLDRYFRVGTELIAFASTDDLIAKVRYYLDHPEEANAIRAAGRRRVLCDHTWGKVWPRILRWLEEAR